MMHLLEYLTFKVPLLPFCRKFPIDVKPKYDNSHGQYVVVSEEAFPPSAFVHHVREVAN